MWKWLTKLRKAKDASLNHSFQFDWLSVCQDGVKSKELFIAGMAGGNCKFHL
jgi:hypothetical protein